MDDYQPKNLIRPLINLKIRLVVPEKSSFVAKTSFFPKKHYFLKMLFVNLELCFIDLIKVITQILEVDMLDYGGFVIMISTHCDRVLIWQSWPKNYYHF